MGSTGDDCVVEGMYNSKEEEVESRTSDSTVAGSGRCRCTVFLVVIGILMISAISIPLFFFIHSQEGN